MKTKSTVDVIVPCYRYGHFLAQCVQSVLSQAGVDVRVLIIDDESPDDTPAVARQLCADDSRVTYRRHAVNQGHIATYNEGIAWTSSEYYLLLSADDMLTPGALSRAVSELDRHPQAVLCHGHAEVLFETQKAADVLMQVQVRTTRTVTTGAKFASAVCRHSADNPVWTPTAVIRTGAQKKVGGYKSELPHSGDLELWLRLSQHGSIIRLDSTQALYRRHGANMHYSYAGVRALEEHMLAIESALCTFQDDPLVVQGLRQSCKRGLALGALRVANHATNLEDSAAFAQALSFIDRVCPDVKYSAAWYRMRLRRVIGKRTLSLARRTLGPIFRRLKSS
jgi:glycosyltransferase involved in cell wall biosynthesis